ncbi:MAG: glutamate-ammonia-ligase adenylyltransferase, partial [Planctomycetota bacterium]
MNHAIESVLSSLRFADEEQAQQSLQQITELGIPTDLLEGFLEQLVRELAKFSEQDRVLTSLHRFLDSSRSPLSFLGLLEREPDALGTLLQLFSTSQYVADLLIRDPDAFDIVRLTDGQPVARSILRDEILAEVRAI